MVKTAFFNALLLCFGLVACGDDGTTPLTDTGTVGDAAGDTSVVSDAAMDGAAMDGAATDGAAMDGAATDGAAMDGAATDGSAGVPGSIMCGRGSCDMATERCCITSMGGGTPRARCIPIDGACDGATADCDGPEDCAEGEVCCGRADTTGGSVMVACVEEATCSGLGTGGLELCHTRADCSDSTHLCCPIVRTGFSGMICSESCVGG